MCQFQFVSTEGFTPGMRANFVPVDQLQYVQAGSQTDRTTTGVELAETSNRSECTRGSETRGAYLTVFHIASGDGETDLTMRRCAPQPSAIAPARYHALYCASRARARFGAYAKSGEYARHRRPGRDRRCKAIMSSLFILSCIGTLHLPHVDRTGFFSMR